MSFRGSPPGSPLDGLRRRRASTASHATQTPEDIDLGQSGKRYSFDGPSDFEFITMDYARSQPGLGGANFANRGRLGNILCIEIARDGTGHTSKEYTRPALLERLNKSAANLASAAAAAAANAAAAHYHHSHHHQGSIGASAPLAIAPPQPAPAVPTHGRPSLAPGMPLAQYVQQQQLYAAAHQQQQQLLSLGRPAPLQPGRWGAGGGGGSAHPSASSFQHAVRHGHVTYRDLHVIGAYERMRGVRLPRG